MEDACAKVGWAQGGVPCWRPTACTEHKQRNQEENTQTTRGEVSEVKDELLEPGKERAGRVPHGAGWGAWGRGSL